MKPASDKEKEEDLEFLRRTLADPVEFEKRANYALDRSIGKYVEQKRKRRA